MIADGLRRTGWAEMPDGTRAGSPKLIDESGFAAYYDPKTADPCGGGRFTWIAAMVLEFLSQKAPPG